MCAFERVGCVYSLPQIVGTGIVAICGCVLKAGIGKKPGDTGQEGVVCRWRSFEDGFAGYWDGHC